MITLEVPNGQGATVTLDIEIGGYLYLVGANGTGKSSLMHQFFLHNTAISHRISGHRQTWFKSDDMELSGLTKSQAEQNRLHQDRQPTAVYRDESAPLRNALSVLRITDQQNDYNRKISEFVRAEDLVSAKECASKDSPLDALNRAFTYANLEVQFTLADNAVLRATKNGSAEYPVAHLSDGERNALLLAADIITVPAGTLLLIDEPERHLHRSIVAPLLAHLFRIRNDCVFVVSTS